MFTALFSFLGGTAFRWLMGAVVDYFNKKQDHDIEMDHLRVQESIDVAAHARNLESLRVQSELGIKEVEVKRDADLAVADASAFIEAVKNVGKPTGVVWVDAWSGCIRPALATVCIYLWVSHLVKVDFVPSVWDLELIGATLGVFVGGRIAATGR